MLREMRIVDDQTKRHATVLAESTTIDFGDDIFSLTRVHSPVGPRSDGEQQSAKTECSHRDFAHTAGVYEQRTTTKHTQSCLKMFKNVIRKLWLRLSCQ